jgi:solute:Na+ symporter, SSS family
MQLWDFIIIGLYFVGTFAIGLYFSGKQQSLKDFFLGGRNVPWWGAAASGIATIVSGVSFLGGPGLAFTSNYHWHQARLAIPLGLLILCGLLLPKLHRLGSPSIYDFLERRFDSATRLAAACIFVLLKVTFLGVVIYAPSLVLGNIFHVPTSVIVVLTGLAATVYTQMGGIKAVIWTDAFQLVVLVGGIVAAILLVALRLEGGLGEVWSTASAAGRLDYFNFSTSLTETYTFWNCLVGGTFIFVSMYGTDQAEIQRFLTTKSPRHANYALIASALGQALVGLTLFFVGTSLFAFYTVYTDRNALGVPGNSIFPKFIVEELPVGLTGLVLAGLLAACMSTISSLLNSLATVMVTDIQPRWRRMVHGESDASALSGARRWTLAFGLLTTTIALFGDRFGNLLDATNRFTNLFGGSLVGIFLLGLTIKGAGGRGGVWGLAAGFSTALFLQLATNFSFMWFGAASATVAFVVGLLTGRPRPPTPDNLLK